MPYTPLAESRTITPAGKRSARRNYRWAVGTPLAAVLAAGLLMGISVESAERSAPPAMVQDAIQLMPGQVLQLTPQQQAELQELTSTPENAKQFQANLQEGLAGFGIAVSDDEPSGTRSNASSAGQLKLVAYDRTVPSTVEFAQGWDRDHWWLTASYADIARGATSAAAAACTRKLPAWICRPVASAIASWARGQGSANNHGIWLAVYRDGRITGGRW